MGKAEAKIERYLVDRVDELGGMSRKYISPGRRGVPDRIVFFTNVVAFVEVKTRVGKLSGLQKREIERLRALSIPVYVVSSEEEINQCLLEITNI